MPSCWHNGYLHGKRPVRALLKRSCLLDLEHPCSLTTRRVSHAYLPVLLPGLPITQFAFPISTTTMALVEPY